MSSPFIHKESRKTLNPEPAGIVKMGKILILEETDSGVHESRSTAVRGR